MIEGSDICGAVGAVLIVFAYARVQWKRDYAKLVRYSFFNLLGSILLFVPVLKFWNNGIFAAALGWFLVSCYGLYRCIKYINLQRAQKRWLADRNAKR
jgi:hypothetical protein